MKIIEFEISNYRSIDHVKFKTLDRNIACFIGRNGSGKSNILNALLNLKNESDLNDMDSHLKVGNDEKPINIKAKFVFEERDEHTLEENGLIDFLKLEGFIVEVTKSKGENASKTLEPLGDATKFNNKKKLNEIFLKIKESINGITMPEDQQVVKEEYLNKSEGIENKSADEIRTLMNDIKTAFQQYGDSASELLAHLKSVEPLVDFTITDALGEVFKKLQIELLSIGGDFDSYQIEEKAPLTELDSRDKRPFLFDLLSLTGTTAKQHISSGDNNKIALEEVSSTNLSRRISNVWRKHKMSFNVTKTNRDSELYFAFRTPQENPIGLMSLSEGEKWFLRFYTRLTVARESKQQVIWLLDEPGKDLHAESQLNLRNYFEEIAGESQIFYTTHNSMMIPWHRIERIHVSENAKDNEGTISGTIIHNRLWKDDVLVSPLRETLGLILGEELLTGNQSLIIEGPSDYLILQGWINYFNDKNRGNAATDKEPQRNLIPISSINNIPFYVSFLVKSTKSKHWVALADSGMKLDEVQNKMLALGIGSFKNRLLNIGQLADIVKKPTDCCDIEDVFKPEEYITEVKEFYQEENYDKLIIPTDKEFEKILKLGPQIVKNIEELFRKKNPEYRIDGKIFNLDKPGIAQQIYRKLVNEGKDNYSRETVARFKKVLAKIEKTYSLEPLEENETTGKQNELEKKEKTPQTKSNLKAKRNRNQKSKSKHH